MAGALGLALAGPRNYGGVRVDDAFMGDGRRAAAAQRYPGRARDFTVAPTRILIAFVAVLAVVIIATA